MVYFPNTTITVYEYTDTMEYDKHGEKLGEYTLKLETEADFQPITVKDQLEQFGKILQDTYRLFLPYETDIKNTDIIIIGDDSYSILGTPEVWNHLLNYKQLTIQKHRKKVEV